MNYNLLMENEIKNILSQNKVPTLFLHACCAPCSSAVLYRLADIFKITIYYYNPNIMEEEEYQKRVLEIKNFIKLIKTKYPISFIEGPYNVNEYLDEIKGLENELEGGSRCFKCYNLRLEKTAQIAKDLNFDYFTTTLSISPYKNAKWLNEIGKSLENKYNIKYLYADFKKKDGYKKSIELSNKYHLYRQNYCGCIYSKR